MEKIKYTLLIDDDETANFLHQTLLEDLEVTESVLIAHNGKEALDIIVKQCLLDRCPELILLDINMPVMNGFEFLKAYEGLELSQKQSVVIAMLTTSLNPQDVKQINDLPVKKYLNKPLTEEMVRELLRQHFNRELPQ